MALTPAQGAANLARLANEVANPSGLMEKVLLIAEGSIKKATPVKQGTTRRSLTHKVDSPLSGRVGTNVEWGRALNDGSRPHIITPKKAKVLAFPGAGGMVFAKRVRHPGTRATHFMEHGVEDAKPRIRSLLTGEGQQMLDRVRG